MAISDRQVETRESLRRAVLGDLVDRCAAAAVPIEGGALDGIEVVSLGTLRGLIANALEDDLPVAGPITLVLYASSSRRDTDFVVKLSEQMVQSEEERRRGLQPAARVVTKGWLRAAHREIDPVRSLENAPWYKHRVRRPLVPGRVYRFEIAVMPCAYLFRKGNRIRLELANGDSQLTENIFHHEYTPDKCGRDTLNLGARRPSQLVLPVMRISDGRG